MELWDKLERISGCQGNLQFEDKFYHSSSPVSGWVFSKDKLRRATHLTHKNPLNSTFYSCPDWMPLRPVFPRLTLAISQEPLQSLSAPSVHREEGASYSPLPWPASFLPSISHIISPWYLIYHGKAVKTSWSLGDHIRSQLVAHGHVIFKKLSERRTERSLWSVSLPRA